MGDVGIREVKAALSEYVNRAAYGQERVIISSRGVPKAALISIDDLQRLEQMELEAEAQMLREAIDQAQEFVPLQEVLAGLLKESE